MLQLAFSSFNYDVSWSTSMAYRRRFTIVKTTLGYTVTDHLTKELQRTTLLVTAQAWAGQRVGDRCVRHAQKW